MSTPPKPGASRIAIKFGGVPSSSSKKPLRPPHSSLGKRPRPSHGLGDSESGSENEGAKGGFERITAFGSNGAELERKHQDSHDGGPLTIARQGNRDWRAEARARHRSNQRRRATSPVVRSQKEDDLVDQDKPIKWGLNLTATTTTVQEGKDKESETNEGGDVARGQDAEKDGDNDAGRKESGGIEDGIDKEAVDALLGKTTDDRTKTRLIIERSSNHVTEDDVFHRDFHDAPDSSTLEEYEAMPVEQFGAALLRGMGWDGKERGTKLKEVKRRPNQMGLGAKELKGAEELGAWNQKNGGRKPRPQKLHEYRREEDKRRERRDERYRDSYKSERDREREDRRHGQSSSSHRHRSRRD